MRLNNFQRNTVGYVVAEFYEMINKYGLDYGSLGSLFDHLEVNEPGDRQELEQAVKDWIQEQGM